MEIFHHTLNGRVKSLANKKAGHNIDTVLEWKGLIIALYWTDEQRFTPTNVYAYDKDGNLMWIIQDPGVSKPDFFNPFGNIWIDEKNRLIADNVIGSDFIVSEIDGSVKFAHPGTRPW